MKARIPKHREFIINLAEDYRKERRMLGQAAGDHGGV